MSEEDIRRIVETVTGYKITKFVRNDSVFNVGVAGSVHPHDRYYVSQNLPITVSVILDEWWEEWGNK